MLTYDTLVTVKLSQVLIVYQYYPIEWPNNVEYNQYATNI